MKRSIDEFLANHVLKVCPKTKQIIINFRTWEFDKNAFKCIPNGMYRYTKTCITNYGQRGCFVQEPIAF